MATHYLLNKLRLEADETGFTLLVPQSENDPQVKIDGEFSEPTLIIAYKLRKEVVDSYIDQPGITKIECIGMVDSTSPTALVLETRFHLTPDTNWFELNHSVFNTVYCDDI